MRTILLSHQPDPRAPASRSFDAHFDWLVELMLAPNPNGRTVATWRLGQRPDRLPVGRVLQAEAIAPHRAFYLDLLAPRQLSGGRGLVYPIARGKIVRQVKEAERWLLDLVWTDGARQQLAVAPDGCVRCLSC